MNNYNMYNDPRVRSYLRGNVPSASTIRSWGPEYYAAGEAAKALVFYRRLASSLGWCPRSATRLFVDSKTTVSLTQSPAVSSKMRHVEQRHHYIRHLHGKSVVHLVYIPGSQMRANVLTKVLPRGLYLQERSRLLNTGADSLRAPSGAAGG